MVAALSDETLLEEGLLDAPAFDRALPGEKTSSDEVSCSPSCAVDADADVCNGRFSSSKSETNYHLNPFFPGRLVGIVLGF